MKNVILSGFVALLLFAGCQADRNPEKLISLKLDKSSISLEVGQRETLTAIGKYLAGQSKVFAPEEVMWASTNENLFTAIDGNIVALAPGIGEVEASVDGKVAYSKVTVLNSDPLPNSENPFHDIPETLHKRLSFIKSVIRDRSFLLHAGVKVTEVSFTTTAGPLQLYFFEVDLSDPSVTLVCTTPFGKPIGNGLETVRNQLIHAESQGPRILGGTNADYFSVNGTYFGSPQGIFWHDGVCQKSSFNSAPVRPRSFFFMTEDKKAYTLPSADYQATVAAMNIAEAFGGGPVLLEQGHEGRDVGSSDNSGLNPRTFIGVTKDAGRVLLAVADGRSISSIGMKYKEMCEIMLALDCWSAINLDGGGSSTFAVRDQVDRSALDFKVLNNPTDGSERAVGPSVAVVALE